MSRVNRNRVAVGLAGLVLTGCVSSGPGSVATFPEPSTTATTLVPLEPSSSTPTTVALAETVPTVPITDPPTTPPAPACSSEGVPGEALEFHELNADLDGDGLPDRLRTFGLATADGLMRWRARLESGSGLVSELDLDDATTPVQPLGTVQVDRNPAAGIGGADEVLVSAGSAGGQLRVQVVAADDAGCLVRLGDALGGVTTFLVGTTPTRFDGLRCESTDGAGRLVQVAAVRASATSYTTTDTRMQRVGPNLLPETVAEGTATAGGEILPRYGMIDCPGISLPT